jgi:hypothetical protein
LYFVFLTSLPSLIRRVNCTIQRVNTLLLFNCLLMSTAVTAPF